MTTAVVVSGRLTDQGNLELDEPIPLAAGPVRVRVEPVVSCGCGEQFPPAQVRKCVDRGKGWITCQVCDERTPLGGAPDCVAPSAPKRLLP